MANPGPQPDSESHLVASNINAVLQGATATSVQEIEMLIGELQALRDMAAQRGSTGSARNRTVFEPDPSRPAVDQDHYRKPRTVEKGLLTRGGRPIDDLRGAPAKRGVKAGAASSLYRGGQRKLFRNCTRKRGHA